MLHLASVIVTSQCDQGQSLVLVKIAISVSVFMREANALVNRLPGTFVTVPKDHVLAKI